MPSTFAHYKIGEEVRGELKENIREAIEEYPELYLIGLHGPDILFYYKPLYSNEVNRIGFKLHERPGKDFFENAKRIINRHDNDNRYLAYIYGVINHFSLDVTCHPYIDEKIDKSGISHGEIEVEFDRELMIIEGMNPIRQSLVDHIIPSMENANVIKEFYDSVSEKQVYKALKSMIFYNKLLVAPSIIKRIFIYLLLKITGNYKEMSGLIVNYNKNFNCNDSTLKLLHLFEKAKKLSIELINEFNMNLNGDSKLSDIYKHTFGGKVIWEESYEV